MAKITKVLKKTTVADIMKQKKLEKAALAKEKQLAAKMAEEARFDEFIRSTAKDMLKGISKYRLHVSDTKASYSIPQFVSDNSIWAPWSKMLIKNK